MSEGIPAITQETVDALLVGLRELRKVIAGKQQVITPLEVDLARAYDEYQAAVGRLRRHAAWLETEIADVCARLEGIDEDQEDHPGREEDKFIRDPEAIEKDQLLEHLFRVLDPDIDDEDAELLSHLHGLCREPTVGLAEVLEQVPWGTVWTARSSQEDLTAQHRRLTVWRKALAQHLEDLSHTAELLKQDPRYALWRRRQKGRDAWHAFLDQAAAELRAQNQALEAELEGLRQQLARRIAYP